MRGSSLQTDLEPRVGPVHARERKDFATSRRHRPRCVASRTRESSRDKKSPAPPRRRGSRVRPEPAEVPSAQAPSQIRAGRRIAIPSRGRRRCSGHRPAPVARACRCRRRRDGLRSDATTPSATRTRCGPARVATRARTAAVPAAPRRCNRATGYSRMSFRPATGERHRPGSRCQARACGLRPALTTKKIERRERGFFVPRQNPPEPSPRHKKQIARPAAPSCHPARTGSRSQRPS